MNEADQQVHARAVVWIDHLVAKIFSMGLTGVSASVVHAHLSSDHLHHKANTIGSGRVQEDSAFLPRIGEALAGCTDLLLIGPGTQKGELAQYLQLVRPEVNLRIEPSDHPTDNEIVALGRRHFRLD
jgi:hypothetical protein